jgi:hypothetical protein
VVMERDRFYGTVTKAKAGLGSYLKIGPWVSLFVGGALCPDICPP